MKTALLNTLVDSTSYSDAVMQIREWSYSGESRCVCAANVHMVMEAWDFPDYKNIINSADMVTPDGMPLVWLMRIRGVTRQQRVYGPTLMLYVLAMAADENISVGFYGGEPTTLEMLVEEMKIRYSGLNVVFAHSPPFRKLSSDEDAQIASQIRNSGARVLFVGLGCPKQERWMAAHRGQIPLVMIGVGAAFDFHAGAKSQAPSWMQKTGLEWLFRFFQEPGRLWRRYLIQNPRFVLLVLADLLGIVKTSH